MARQRSHFIAFADSQPTACCREPFDSDRLQKLEQAVGQLQKRNAELEEEVAGLKKRSSWAPVAGAEGKTKTEVGE